MSKHQQMKKGAVLLIDGECVLCSRIVQFVVRFDRKRRYRFAALQSVAGQRLLLQEKLPLNDFDTFVLIEEGRYYYKSGAALRVMRGLGRGWTLWYGFMLVPTPIRNKVYDWVAGSRYRLFGRTETCMVPSAEVRDRFLKDGY